MANQQSAPRSISHQHAPHRKMAAGPGMRYPRPMQASRRIALKGLSGAALLPLTRAQTQVTPELVTFRPEIEPLVRLIERTPREKCAEVFAQQLRSGVAYRQLMAALFLAGVRNVNPRPPGFALHCVFVIHAAHLLSQEAPADVRMLPLFYALDNFKGAVETDAKKPVDYVMRVLNDKLPPPDRAKAELDAAMDTWEPERAERAAVTLARYHGHGEVFEWMWRYGARDYRNIGHKAIFVANASRTLQSIGWQHAEPVLRSLVLGLLDFGKEQALNGYAWEDQCYHANVRRARETSRKLKAGWSDSVADRSATLGVLDAIRAGDPDKASAEVARRLSEGKLTAGSAWDAVHLASAELRMRSMGGAVIGGIHAVSSANALRYAFLSAQDTETRLLMLLQGVGWMGQFWHWTLGTPDRMRAFRIDALEPEEGSVEETLASVPSKLDTAASRALKLARDPASRAALLAAATRVTVSKANEVHYFKYLAALIEDIPLMSAEWQPHMTAATVYYLKGAGEPDAPPMKRAREALQA